MSRWVIDREGLRHGDRCVAYVDDLGDAEHPAALSGAWHVFESSRGLHLADAGLAVSVPADAPAAILGCAQGQKRLPEGPGPSAGKRMRIGDAPGHPVRFAALGA